MKLKEKTWIATSLTLLAMTRSLKNPSLRVLQKAGRSNPEIILFSMFRFPRTRVRFRGDDNARIFAFASNDNLISRKIQKGMTSVVVYQRKHGVEN